MTQLTLEPSGRMALVSNMDLSNRSPEQQPVYFYDGEFRSFPQIERRVQINAAVAAYAARPIYLDQMPFSS